MLSKHLQATPPPHPEIMSHDKHLEAIDGVSANWTCPRFFFSVICFVVQLWQLHDVAAIGLCDITQLGWVALYAHKVNKVQTWYEPQSLELLLSVVLQM